MEASKGGHGARERRAWMEVGKKTMEVAKRGHRGRERRAWSQKKVMEAEMEDMEASIENRTIKELPIKLQCFLERWWLGRWCRPWCPWRATWHVLNIGL
jgi:hypothetical protein